MQALFDFHALHTSSSAAAGSSGTKDKVEPRISLVMEHFSVLDQPLLDAFAAGESGIAELAQAYAEKSDEGFDVMHYAPLLVLAQELGGIRLVGAFPPRAWARVAFSKDAEKGLAGVKSIEAQRVRDDKSAAAVPRFEAWDLASHISIAHRAYIKSLMRPDQPIQIAADYEQQEQPPAQEAGFETAQALKDSFFAHAIVSQFAGQTEGDSAAAVFAICGLGHGEYGFGAPERVVQLLQRRGTIQDGGDEEWTPFLIVSKPEDGSYWIGDASKQDDTGVAWNSDPWRRKMADAVVLYEWHDDEEE